MVLKHKDPTRNCLQSLAKLTEKTKEENVLTFSNFTILLRHLLIQFYAF